jgi:hypothetical protein
MAARCPPATNRADQLRIGVDVDVLIDFAKRSPEARFAIDDETGRSVDLLLIAAFETPDLRPAGLPDAQTRRWPSFGPHRKRLLPPRREPLVAIRARSGGGQMARTSSRPWT